MEEGVALLAGCHLYADAVLPRIVGSVEVNPVQHHAKGAAKVGAEALVAVRLRPTQVEVAVSSLTLVAQLQHHPEQSHRVGAAAQGHQYARLAAVLQGGRGHDGMTLDALGNNLWERSRHRLYARLI